MPKEPVVHAKDVQTSLSCFGDFSGGSKKVERRCGQIIMKLRKWGVAARASPTTYCCRNIKKARQNVLFTSRRSLGMCRRGGGMPDVAAICDSVSG